MNDDSELKRLRGGNSSDTNLATDSSSSPDSNNEKQQQQTPLPKRIFVPLILCLFMESISYVTPFPFIGNFVAHLMNAPIVESGRYSGLIVGCFYLGTILSGSWWGRISDQFGRKIVVMFGLTMQGVLELLFGLAPNIYVCFTVRLMQGVMNGAQSSVKTIIAESTDSTNESLGFSLMSFAWSGGTFVGMALGGSYGLWNLEIGGYTFPAFLPCLAMSIFAFLCVIAIHVVLPETNPRVLPLSWGALREFIASGGVVTAPTSPSAIFTGALNPSASFSSGGGTSTTCIVAADKQQEGGDNNKAATASGGSSDNSNNNNNNNVPLVNPDDDFTFTKMFQLPPLRAAMIDYLLLGSHEIFFDEVFPLLAVSPNTVAGLAMTVGQVAWVLLYSGVFMLVSVFAFPVVRRWYGDYVYVYGSAVLCFCYIAIPQFEIAASWADRPYKFYPLAVLVPFRTWANDFCYSQAMLMIPRSAPPELVGTVTSMSTTAAAVVRLAVPPIGSALFSFSVTTLVSFYPYNSTLCFSICSLLALAGAIHRRNVILKQANKVAVSNA